MRSNRRSFRLMRNILTWKIALGVVILGLRGAPARADLVVNGSFETPVVPVGGFTNFLSGSTGITGWTVVGPEASIASGSLIEFGISFPAEDGNQWVDLTGFGSNQVEGIKQDIPTTIGATYD